MRRITNGVGMSLVLIGMVAIGGAVGHSQTLGRVMRLKLEHAQAILSGLVLEDYDAVQREARELGSLTETTGWGAFRTPEYKGHSADFLGACEAVVEAARQRSIDAVALEYVNLTLKCVQCHKYVRGARLAKRLPAPWDPVGEEPGLESLTR